MAEGQDFGLHSGLSIPQHGARGELGMLSLASEEARERAESRIQEAVPYIHLLTAHLQEAVRRVLEVVVIGPKPELSEREKECLLWAAEGKTSWEISQILGISERTVIFHLQNAADKLQVVNRQQAIARAVATGLIIPQFS